MHCTIDATKKRLNARRWLTYFALALAVPLAQASRDALASLNEFSKISMLEFLNSLVRFPQRGHGSIRLPVLFNNPSELE